MSLTHGVPHTGAADPDPDQGALGADPDATRVSTVATPLAEMPSITAANSRRAQAPTNPATGPRPPTWPTTDTLPGGAAAGDVPVRQVGRYQITSRLGRGGMASVFLARDPSLGREVAIKFLHTALCEDDDCRARFLREARAAGGLAHPNIVTVHDVGEIE